MGLPFIPSGPRFAITPARTAFGTVVTALIPPFRGPKDAAPLLYQVVNGIPNWMGQLFTTILSMPILNSSTANAITILRPLNWTYFPSGLAKNTTAIPNSTTTGIAADPGLYATAFKYPMPNGSTSGPGQVSDAAISSTNKYVAYQLQDGTWMLDTIASGTFGSSLTLTTGTPNRTNGAIITGAPLFYFGATTLSNPQTGVAHLNTVPTVSVTEDLLGGKDVGIATLNAGDPMVVYNANATATTMILGVLGQYSSF